jgi:hypothetical protein
MDLLKEFAIKPPGVSDYINKQIKGTNLTIKQKETITIETDTQTYQENEKEKWAFPQDKVKGLTYITHKIIKNNQKIVYVDLEKDTSQPDMARMDIWLHKEEKSMVPVYYLPWGSGVAMQLDIPSNQKLQNANIDITDKEKHPNLFFTAGLSGCSIIFKGTEYSPTIFHCGLESGNVKAQLDNKFWEQVLDKTVGGLQGGMHKGYYKGSDIEKIIMSKLINNQHMIKVCEIVPWGTVFGYRETDKWAFYLQQNTLISYKGYKKVTRKAGLFYMSQIVEHKLDSEYKTICIPMYIAKIFPGGSGSVIMESKFREIK